MRALGYEILFLDEATFSLKPHIVKAWYQKGSKPTAKYVINTFQKIHVFGALGNQKTITKLSPKINSRKYLPFLMRLKKNYPKLCIIVDNARWHLTKKLRAYIKRNGIKMIQLLPYSPELNPIEQYWKNIKQYLGAKPIFCKDQLIRELRNALRKDIFIPSTSDY